TVLKSVLYKVHWCYSSQDRSCGPSTWKDTVSTCGGQNQSPVDLDRQNMQRNKSLGRFTFRGYNIVPPGKWKVVNNGHAVQVNVEGNTIMGYINISGAGLPNTFRALQFHFHWGNATQNGSEHTLDKEQYPMELHIVHINAKYNKIIDAKKDPNGLAVLGFFYQNNDASNSNYNTIVASLKNVSYKGDEVDLASTFRLDSLLPPVQKLSRYYRYRGSLTTPDCKEAVIWTVFEEPIQISQSQYNEFVNTVFFSARGETEMRMQNNFRPPLPLNKRKVYASKDASMSASSSLHFSLAVLSLTVLIDIFI
uniref:Carbonic anhydrase n=1 Tax=Latimeria chalumnae TaxID=7897 RepID=H3A5Q0_LATCH